MSELSFDIFFNEKDGYEAHIQVKAASTSDLAGERDKILELLTDIEARPRFNRGATAGNATATVAGGPSGDAMVAAAKAVFPGATVEARCPTDGSPMKLVAAGVSRRTNKPYGAFYACSICQHKQQA